MTSSMTNRIAQIDHRMGALEETLRDAVAWYDRSSKTAELGYVDWVVVAHYLLKQSEAEQEKEVEAKNHGRQETEAT